ncbi:hypothetical protein AALP_AA7G204700 [Arabis alpina]|uniref:Uncharacterized protein n=1 Tax=Arabis alpina TaxID=50452 RepID=A0A087GJE7_ARAAL|nr:hypothetical protein AALP_AA7G204700 [Arabis alpina]
MRTVTDLNMQLSSTSSCSVCLSLLMSRSPSLGLGSPPHRVFLPWCLGFSPTVSA